MVRHMLLIAATASLTCCATHEGISQCGRPGAMLAQTDLPADWENRLVPVPELPNFDWATAQERNGKYKLADGRVFIDAMPVRPPSPHYPSQAAADRREGECIVRFTIEKDGHSSNIRAVCSDPVFLSSAQAAAKDILFTPATIDSRPVVRNNIFYPIYFCRPR